MASLRARLFVGLSALVVATNVGLGLLSLHRADEEATEFQDAVLRQVGRFALAAPLAMDPRPDDHVEGDAHVIIEELDANPAPGTLAAALPPREPDGMATVGRTGRVWRVLVQTRADGSRVAVGQSVAAREEIVGNSVFNTVLPLMMLVPLLLLLVGLVIHVSMRPVSRLAARLDSRSADDLRTLPPAGIPNELLPFIGSINRLLGRVSQLFEQRRRFVADSAHELRTPLTALTVQVDNLARLDMSPEGQDRLRALQGGIRRVGHLVEQLLSLARYEDGPAAAPLPAASVDAIAKEVVADLLPQAVALGIDLGFLRVDPVWVRADPTALAAMIRNLVDNALRHGAEGGSVDLDVHRDGARAILAVADSGPGIPPAELTRIFDPFVRGSGATADGTGLGLSIVRSIAASCGGSVHLANRPAHEGGGLRACVDLPAIDGPDR